MKCPACQFNLSAVKAGDIEIDVCQRGCGGLFFDWNELKKFDEPHEFIPEMVLNPRSRPARPPATPSAGPGASARKCPKCKDVMCRRYFDIKNQVEVDQCLKCSGIWLDVGELVAIRSQYKTEAERFKAADEYLDNSLQQISEQMFEDTALKMRRSVADVKRVASDNVIEMSLLTKLIHALMRRGSAADS